MTNSTELLCSGDERILSAIPPGGSFSVLSGPGVIIGDTLHANGTGEIQIQYTWNQNGCSANATQIIMAQQSPGVTFANSQDHFCMQDSIALIANPQGGIFELLSGPGAFSNSVLTSTGEGLIKILYLINEEDCYGEITQQIPSRKTPTVEFETDSLNVCVEEENLIGIIPDLSQLTLLSGPGILNGHLLTSTDTGLLTVAGQFETNGCVGADTLIISSHSIPAPEITLTNPVICDGTSIQLTAIPPGGTFTILSGAGTINGNVLTAQDIGPIQIAYMVEEHQCAGTDYGEILVINPVAELIVDGDMLTSGSSVGVFQWLDCENNFEPLPDESNDTLMVTFPGTYALVNGVGDCMDTSACVQVVLTGIQINETDREIRIFPNPVSSRLFINGFDGLPVREINLRNAIGEKVYTLRDVHSSASMDLSGCGLGLYFLEMRFMNGGNYIFRVVKI